MSARFVKVITVVVVALFYTKCCSSLTEAQLDGYQGPFRVNYCEDGAPSRNDDLAKICRGYGECQYVDVIFEDNLTVKKRKYIGLCYEEMNYREDFHAPIDYQKKYTNCVTYAGVFWDWSDAQQACLLYRQHHLPGSSTAAGGASTSTTASLGVPSMSAFGPARRAQPTNRVDPYANASRDRGSNRSGNAQSSNRSNRRG